jgi:predicted  nucleic acid-binding Zn-ribbon protein
MATAPQQFRSNREMTKPDLAPIERVQAIMQETNAPLAKLEEGMRDLQRVIASGEAEIEELAARRKIEMTALTPAVELDKKLNELDKRRKEVERCAEIASAVIGELEARLVQARAAERAAQLKAAKAEAEKRVRATSARWQDLLERFGPEVRAAMHDYGETARLVAAINSELPAGEKIDGIEAYRKSAPPPPRSTVIERFAAFTRGGVFVARFDGTAARRRHDNLWDVWAPVRSQSVSGDAPPGAAVVVCELKEFVTVRTETFAVPSPAKLPTTLRIPAFSAGERDWWVPVAAGDSYLSYTLEKLESTSAPSFSVNSKKSETLLLAEATAQGLISGVAVKAVAAE